MFLHADFVGIESRQWMLSIAASTCTRRLLHCTCLELSPGCAACTSPFTTTVYDTVQRGTGGIKMTLWTDRSYGGRDSCALCKVPFRTELTRTSEIAMPPTLIYTLHLDLMSPFPPFPPVIIPTISFKDFPFHLPIVDLVF